MSVLPSPRVKRERPPTPEPPVPAIVVVPREPPVPAIEIHRQSCDETSTVRLSEYECYNAHLLRDWFLDVYIPSSPYSLDRERDTGPRKQPLRVYEIYAALEPKPTLEVLDIYLRPILLMYRKYRTFVRQTMSQPIFMNFIRFYRQSMNRIPWEDPAIDTIAYHIRTLLGPILKPVYDMQRQLTEYTSQWGTALFNTTWLDMVRFGRYLQSLGQQHMDEYERNIKNAQYGLRQILGREWNEKAYQRIQDQQKVREHATYEITRAEITKKSVLSKYRGRPGELRKVMIPMVRTLGRTRAWLKYRFPRRVFEPEGLFTFPPLEETHISDCERTVPIVDCDQQGIIALYERKDKKNCYDASMLWRWILDSYIPCSPYSLMHIEGPNHERIHEERLVSSLDSRKQRWFHLYRESFDDRKRINIKHWKKILFELEHHDLLDRLNNVIGYEPVRKTRMPWHEKNLLYELEDWKSWNSQTDMTWADIIPLGKSIQERAQRYDQVYRRLLYTYRSHLRLLIVDDPLNPENVEYYTRRWSHAYRIREMRTLKMLDSIQLIPKEIEKIEKEEKKRRQREEDEPTFEESVQKNIERQTDHRRRDFVRKAGFTNLWYHTKWMTMYIERQMQKKREEQEQKRIEIQNQEYADQRRMMFALFQIRLPPPSPVSLPEISEIPPLPPAPLPPIPQKTIEEILAGLQEFIPKS